MVGRWLRLNRGGGNGAAALWRVNGGFDSSESFPEARRCLWT
jgi:hypothetical protein